MAIIAILAAMLLPALQSTLKKARNNACFNNLKQLGYGTISYVGDFDEYLMTNVTLPVSAPLQYHNLHVIRIFAFCKKEILCY